MQNGSEATEETPHTQMLRAIDKAIGIARSGVEGGTVSGHIPTALSKMRSQVDGDSRMTVHSRQPSGEGYGAS